MATLSEHLDRLEAWLRRNPEAPAWQAVRLVEAGQIQYGPIDHIPCAALCSVATYAPRFKALLAASYSWINLSALGVHDRYLLVCIERPQDPARVPPGHTRVNLSGPPIDWKTGARVWDVSVRMRVSGEELR